MYDSGWSSDLERPLSHARRAALPHLPSNCSERGRNPGARSNRSAICLKSGHGFGARGLLESSNVNLTTPTRNLERALDLFADAVFYPSFSDSEFLRLKLARLEDLKARADDPRTIAEDVLPRLLYHPDHPYARTKLGTPESVRSISLEDVVAFYRWAFVPGNASLVIVGDVQPDAIVSALETRFGKWPSGPIPGAPDLRPKASSTVGRTIYLIDKPGSAQSVVSIGRVGTSVRSPDRHALVILKDKLGGRIASNLIDDKAWTYGFSETFDFREGPGPFVVTGSVHTWDTKHALVEIFREMNNLAGPKPVTEEEVTDIQQAKLTKLIDGIETGADVAAQVAFMVSHQLPKHHFARKGPCTTR